MLSELRKYRVGLVLAHQHLSQLEPEVRDAALGNVGTLVTFRVGANDARFVACELMPRFDAVDVIALPQYSMYVRLMIDGATSQPFSAEALANPPEENALGT